MAFGAALAPVLGGLGIGAETSAALSPILVGAGEGALVGGLTGQGAGLGAALGAGGGLLSDITGGFGGLGGGLFGGTAPTGGPAIGLGGAGAASGLGTPVPSTLPGAGAEPSYGGLGPAGGLGGDIQYGTQYPVGTAPASPGAGDVGGATTASGGNLAPTGALSASPASAAGQPGGLSGTPITASSSGFDAGGGSDPTNVTVGNVGSPGAGGAVGPQGPMGAAGPPVSLLPTGAGDGGGAPWQTVTNPADIAAVSPDPYQALGAYQAAGGAGGTTAAGSQGPLGSIGNMLGKNPMSLLSGGLGLMQLMNMQKQMNQQVAPLQQALTSTQGMQTAMMAPAMTGVLPAGQQQALETARRNQKAAVRGQAANAGMSGSTMERDALENVDANIAAQQVSIENQLLQQAGQLAGVQGTEAENLVRTQMAQDQAYNQALSRFVQGLLPGNLGGGGGGSSTTAA